MIVSPPLEGAEIFIFKKSLVVKKKILTFAN